MNRFLSIVLAVIAVAVIGCKAETLAGTYAGPNNANLVLGEDNKFSTTGPGPMTGTWSSQDKKVVLKVETIDGKPPKQMIEELSKMASAMGGAQAKQFAAQKDQILKELDGLQLTVSEDKKTLTMNSTLPGAQTVTFTKQEAK